MSGELLYQVDAPPVVGLAPKCGKAGFCAGLVVGSDDRVTEAAAVLRWTIGKHRDELRPYFKRRGWKVTYCGPYKAKKEARG